ncbi:unnamed protein product [Onchocerca flexuosa]|uniref:PH domain-containing protein n=1 Tax=Onchocerca flexuosa TaxID=387005 RepID=A0A183H9T2_9BILA|nr:unnamed protein product [Onchocerca flexuosa]
MAVIANVTSVDYLDDTQSSFTNPVESIIFEDNRREQQKWIFTMLYLYHRYKLNTQTIEEQKPDIAEFSIIVKSNNVISAIKIESKIMHLIFMLRIFNSKIKQNNVYIVGKPEKAIQEVTFAIQDIKMMITERGALDINAMFRGWLTAIICTLRRVYETNNLQNTVHLAVESMKLNYITGSSFVIKTNAEKDNNDEEEEGNSSSKQKTKLNNV